MPREKGPLQGTKATCGDFAPPAASACSISGTCWCSSGLYALKLAKRSGWCVPCLGCAPEPEEPVTETTVESAGSPPDLAIGQRARIAAEAWQPGLATSRQPGACAAARPPHSGRPYAAFASTSGAGWGQP